ncbi:hypothetical protein DFP73DRAFT_534500 [Morchella snyderi]|nr:hypothetical protein DFP73DRAFT_534500 [Morchella snyderi]
MVVILGFLISLELKAGVGWSSKATQLARRQYSIFSPKTTLMHRCLHNIERNVNPELFQRLNSLPLRQPARKVQTSVGVDSLVGAPPLKQLSPWLGKKSYQDCTNPKSEILKN